MRKETMVREKSEKRIDAAALAGGKGNVATKRDIDNNKKILG